MDQRRIFFIVFVVVIIAGFLRLYHLPSLPPGLYPDEAMNGNNALEALRGGDFSAEGGPASGWKVYYPENNGREGLFMNIQAMFLAFFLKFNPTPEPWMLRFASALFGIGTVLGMYFLGRELFRRRAAGLIASFLMATSFWHIMFSRIGFRAIMAPFFLVWASFFLLKAIRDAHDMRAPNSLLASRYWLFAVLGGLFFGLGFYSYIAYRVAPLLFFLFIPFFARERRFWRIAGAFVAVAFLVALPLGAYYLNHPADFFGRTSQVSVFSSPTPWKDLGLNIAKTAGMLFFAGDWNWRHNYAGQAQLFWPVGILFLAGAAFGVARAFRALRARMLFSADGDQGFAWKFAFGWLALAALPVVISDEGIPHALRAILMIPPVFLIAAAAGTRLYDCLLARFSPRAMATGTAFVMAALIAQAYTAYFIRWGRNPNVPGAFAANYVDIGRAINALPRELPKYVFVDAGGVEVRGIPMPAQTVMFITDTFLPERQREKNVRYILPKDQAAVPPDGAVFFVR